MKVFEIIILIFFFLLKTSICSLEIELIKNNQTYIVYSNNKIDQHFQYNKQSDISDCSPKKIYFENKDTNNTIFSIRNTDKDKGEKEENINGENLEIEDFILKSSNDEIKTNFSFKKNNDSLIMNIEHKCDSNIETKNQETNDAKSNSNYWGIINFEFSIKGVEDKIKLEFVKFCKQPELMGSIITAILLFTMATIFVIASTYSEISLELTEIKQHGELKYWHGIVFIVSGSVVLILIFYFIKYINIIFTFLISFQIFIAMYLTIKTLYEYLGLNKNHRLKFLNNHIKFLKNILKIEVEIYSFILIVVTIILVISYLITKHWILNNIFGFALVFTILSLFHIRSYKICAVLLFSAFLYDVFWVYISPYFFTQNVMVVAATSLNMPIKLEIPILFDRHPLKSCMFLGLGDLVLPGFVLKFCHRFDFIKHTSVYYKTSILLYVIALTLSGIVIAVFNYPQPVLFYMCPIILGGILLTAYCRNEIGDIWNADVLEENLTFRNTQEISGHEGDIVSPQYNYINNPDAAENYSEIENKSIFGFRNEINKADSSDDINNL